MCFISTNKQPIFNRRANKQLVNSENWSLYYVTEIFYEISEFIYLEITPYVPALCYQIVTDLHPAAKSNTRTVVYLPYFDYKLKSSEIPGSLFNSLIITVCIKNFHTPTQCVKSLL